MTDTYTTKINEVGDIIVFKNGRYFADIEYKGSCETIVGELNRLDREVQNFNLFKKVVDLLEIQNDNLNKINDTLMEIDTTLVQIDGTIQFR